MIKAPQLPSSWALAPLDAVAELNPRSFSVLPGAESGAVHFVPMAAVSEEFGGIDVSQSRPLSEVRKGYTSFTANDVLFAKITPCMENGKIALVPTLPNHIAYGSTEFHVLRPCEAVEPKWLAHFLSQKTFRELARQNMTGSAGQMRVPTSWLSAAQLPVAPRTEQSRIVEKLEELLSDLDAGVAELKAAQKKLTLYRQSLLKAAVEGALTADWRARRVARGEPLETGPELLARILIERRTRWEARQLAKFKEQGKTPPKGWQARYSETTPPDTQLWPELPPEWTWTRVSVAGRVQLGRQRSPQFHSGENMVPYLRVANVFEERIDVSDVMAMHFSKADESTYRLEPKDILLNEGQSLELVGRPAMYRGELERACFTNTLVRFQAASGVVSEFALLVFLHYMHSGRFRKIAKITTNIAHLGAERFSDLPFPLPPIDEQMQIVSSYASIIENVEAQQREIELSLKRATAQRKNLLKAAFSGQLVPQDPDDEPASELLARIRAERETRVSGSTTRRPRRTLHA